MSKELEVKLKVDSKSVELGYNLCLKINSLLNDYYDGKNTTEFEQFAKFLGYDVERFAFSSDLILLNRDIVVLRELFSDLQMVVNYAQLGKISDKVNERFFINNKTEEN